MRKTILTILVIGTITLGVTGCKEAKEKESSDIHSFEATIIECEDKSMIVRPNEDEAEYKSSDKFRIKYTDDFNYCKVDDKVKITYEGMINESYPAQVGATNIEIIDFDFYITKDQTNTGRKLNRYYANDDRTIYFLGNLNEFYIKKQGNDITLKNYLSTNSQTFDNEIKFITSKLELKDTLKDGGTKIYKSKDKDITMIVCNTIENNKNILIGDYSMEYVDGDCQK